jgi:hypothetical protein
MVRVRTLLALAIALTGCKKALDCTDSCASGGRCVVQDDKCVPGGPDDCLKSAECKASGDCGVHPKGHQCAPRNAADCEASEGCKNPSGRDYDGKGRCKYDVLMRRCEVTPWNSPCVEACLDSGLCESDSDNVTKMEHGEVVRGSVFRGCLPATDVQCKESKACAREGRCKAGKKQCVPASEADCKASEKCKTEGLCLFDASQGADQASCNVARDKCSGTDGCKFRGECTPVAGKCEIASDADCAGAERCRRFGLCKLANGGGCMPRNAADCTNSEQCKKDGKECKFVEKYGRTRCE